MILSTNQVAGILEIAERFVGAFVKRNGPDSKYIVCG